MHENKLVNYSIIFIAVVLLAIVFQTFQGVLRPFAIALLLFFLVTPLARFSRKKKIPVWLTFGGLFVIAVLLLSLINSYVSVENLDLTNAIPHYQKKISQSSGGLISLASNLGFDLKEMTPQKLGALAAKGAAEALKAARTFISETLLALILLMFIIQSVAGLLRLVEKKYGKDEAERLRATLQKIEGDILTYFGTKAAMSLGTALGTGIVLWLFNAKYIFLSLLAVFILNFIPLIGSLVAVVMVMAVYLLTFGLSVKAAWLFLGLMAVQVLFGSVLEPKIAGDRLNMSPLVIIFSLYVWGWIWGIVGMLISVPLTILILILIKHLGPMKSAGGDGLAQGQ